MRAVWAMFCLCWFATVAAASSDAAPPLMPANEAVSIAERFAQKLNLPLKGVAKTEFLDPNRNFLTPPSWSVRFDPSGTVQVDAETGQVLAFQVSSSTTARRGRRTISQGQVVDTATKVAEAMGRPEDAVLESALRSSYENDWSVTWRRRTPDGIPFYDDELTVHLGSASGQPTGAHMRWSGRMPESMEVRVSKEQAEALALRFATKRGPLLRKPTFTAELRIVHPNGHWTKDSLRGVRYDDPTRLAWVVEVLREPAQVSRMIFWIDAANGSLLGGSEPIFHAVRRSGG